VWVSDVVWVSEVEVAKLSKRAKFELAKTAKLR
jgi:hypothetical protein